MVYWILHRKVSNEEALAFALYLVKPESLADHAKGGYAYGVLIILRWIFTIIKIRQWRAYFIPTSLIKKDLPDYIGNQKIISFLFKKC
jgi:hypothetical protein